MQRIALPKASAGMVLAKAVAREDGLVLLGEGVILTDAIIERIRSSGVGSVWVEGNPLGPSGDVGNLRVIAESLPHLFRRHTGNVFMTTMCNVFLRHFKRKMAEQQALEDARIEAARQAEEARRAEREAALREGPGAAGGGAGA